MRNLVEQLQMIEESLVNKLKADHGVAIRADGEVECADFFKEIVDEPDVKIASEC